MDDNLTREELQFFNDFVLSRPLDGVNLYTSEKVLKLLSKINKLLINQIEAGK